jgi:hypothetical protein
MEPLFIILLLVWSGVHTPRPPPQEKPRLNAGKKYFNFGTGISLRGVSLI